MDVISRHYIEAEGLKFIDTRGIMEYFKEDIATRMSRKQTTVAWALAHQSWQTARV